MRDCEDWSLDKSDDDGHHLLLLFVSSHRRLIRQENILWGTWRFLGEVVGKVAGDESSLDAAEASMALRLRASVFVDEMTVVSEVP